MLVPRSSLTLKRLLTFSLQYSILTVVYCIENVDIIDKRRSFVLYLIIIAIEQIRQTIMDLAISDI